MIDRFSQPISGGIWDRHDDTEKSSDDIKAITARCSENKDHITELSKDKCVTLLTLLLQRSSIEIKKFSKQLHSNEPINFDNENSLTNTEKLAFKGLLKAHDRTPFGFTDDGKLKNKLTYLLKKLKNNVTKIKNELKLQDDNRRQVELIDIITNKILSQYNNKTISRGGFVDIMVISKFIVSTKKEDDPSISVISNDDNTISVKVNNDSFTVDTYNTVNQNTTITEQNLDRILKDKFRGLFKHKTINTKTFNELISDLFQSIQFKKGDLDNLELRSMNDGSHEIRFGIKDVNPQKIENINIYFEKMQNNKKEAKRSKN